MNHEWQHAYERDRHDPRADVIPKSLNRADWPHWAIGSEQDRKSVLNNIQRGGYELNKGQDAYGAFNGPPKEHQHVLAIAHASISASVAFKTSSFVTPGASSFSLKRRFP